VALQLQDDFDDFQCQMDCQMDTSKAISKKNYHILALILPHLLVQFQRHHIPCGIFLNALEVAKPFPFQRHFLAIYPLVNIQKTMENHHFHGKTHYFYGHFQ